MRLHDPAPGEGLVDGDGPTERVGEVRGQLLDRAGRAAPPAAATEAGGGPLPARVRPHGRAGGRHGVRVEPEQEAAGAGELLEPAVIGPVMSSRCVSSASRGSR